MSVKFLSTADQNEFSEVLQGGSELKDLFLQFMAQLELNTDYDTVMVAFADGGLRAALEDAPLSVVFSEDEQSVTLFKVDDFDELIELQQWDFDEDAVEEAVDFIGDQVFTSETYGA